MCFKRVEISVIWTLSVLASLCVARLTRLPPKNIQAVAGDTVSIQCFTENKEYPPSWSHTRVGSKQSNDVYLLFKPPGQEALSGRMTTEYFGRFVVLEDRTTGKYSLQATDVQPEDAGTYTCAARGGLGQQASAELGVLESNAKCGSNATEVIGENICNYKPDSIELSCDFGYRGNVLPIVHWVKTDQPNHVVRVREAEFTDDSGKAVSKFIVRADTDDLDGSSFMCIVSSSNDPKESRLNCTTPVINVLKIANVTESRIVDEPEEVQCSPPHYLPETGCKWVKRKLEGDETEVVVTKGRLLNLYKPEFESGGTYVCIIECDIRGQSCPVEVLTITYEPAERVSKKSVTSSSTSNLSVILIVVLSVVVGGLTIAGITVAAVKLYRNKSFKTSKPSAESRGTLDDSNRNSINSDEGRTASGTESVPLTGSESSNVAVDMPDTPIVPGGYEDRLLRNQLSEERAQARMRKNAAMRKSLESSTDPTDVAEGIRGPQEESPKDE